MNKQKKVKLKKFLLIYIDIVSVDKRLKYIEAKYQVLNEEKKEVYYDIIAQIKYKL